MALQCALKFFHPAKQNRATILSYNLPVLTADFSDFIFICFLFCFHFFFSSFCEVSYFTLFQLCVFSTLSKCAKCASVCGCVWVCEAVSLCVCVFCHLKTEAKCCERAQLNEDPRVVSLPCYTLHEYGSGYAKFVGRGRFYLGLQVVFTNYIFPSLHSLGLHLSLYFYDLFFIFQGILQTCVFTYHCLSSLLLPLFKCQLLPLLASSSSQFPASPTLSPFPASCPAVARVFPTDSWTALSTFSTAHTLMPRLAPHVRPLERAPLSAPSIPSASSGPGNEAASRCV